ncbi:MAG TPA: metallophosphoesterase [Terracidiphilus sp.]|nr:metallophosphoesterase [Terracidiphilus sp.]
MHLPLREPLKRRAHIFLAFISICSLLLDASAARAEKIDVNPTFTITRYSPGSPIHMVGYGDMRFTDPSVKVGTNPRVRKWLAERVGEENPEVLLLTGDMPYIGGTDADWQVFRDETASWRRNQVLQLPTIGNHEVRGGFQRGIANYLQNFPDIKGHRYYSVLMGSVEVISLDMTTPSGGTSTQATWFAAQLDHLPKQVEFLFILYHTPWVVDEQSKLFTNLPSKEALTLRHLLEIHLHKMHAKVIVFTGHVHNYERFERNGVEYVISGGGGAEPYPLLFRGREDLYRDTVFPVYHYLTLDYQSGKLRAVMWKVKDPEADTLSVEKKDEFTLIAEPNKTGVFIPLKKAAVPRLP